MPSSRYRFSSSNYDDDVTFQVNRADEMASLQRIHAK